MRGLNAPDRNETLAATVQGDERIAFLHDSPGGRTTPIMVSNPRAYVNWSGKGENKAFEPALVIDVQAFAGDDSS